MHKVGHKLFLIAIIATLGIMIFNSAMAAETKTLSVVMQDWGDAATRTIFLEQIVPAFEKAHPGVKVDWKWTDWGTYVTKYVTACEAPT